MKCRSASCPNFDRRTQLEPAPAPPAAPARALSGGFDPGADAVTLNYVNHRGEERSYVADRKSLRQRGEHVTARLAPTGKAAAFSKKWLRNRSEIESLAAQTARGEDLWGSLSAVERQIVGYYRKRKATSPRYEEILRKYPGLSG